MKLLLCVLSALLLAGCAAGGGIRGCDLRICASCHRGNRRSSADSRPRSRCAAGTGATGAAVLDYDDIRLIDYERAMQTYPETDYYTMCKDGLWGLMRSDGTEVLSCRAPEPLFECDIDEHHWHGYLDGLAWEESDPLEREYNARLKASGDGTLRRS